MEYRKYEDRLQRQIKGITDDTICVCPPLNHTNLGWGHISGMNVSDRANNVVGTGQGPAIWDDVRPFPRGAAVIVQFGKPVSLFGVELPTVHYHPQEAEIRKACNHELGYAWINSNGSSQKVPTSE